MSLTPENLWWAVDHGVPRRERDNKPAKFLLDLYKLKTSRSSEQRFTLNHKNRVS